MQKNKKTSNAEAFFNVDKKQYTTCISECQLFECNRFETENQGLSVTVKKYLNTQGLNIMSGADMPLPCLEDLATFTEVRYP